jgi:hypothetical protein
MNAKFREDFSGKDASRRPGGDSQLAPRREFDGEIERVDRTVVAAGLEVHRTLGPGLLEHRAEKWELVFRKNDAKSKT